MDLDYVVVFVVLASLLAFTLTQARLSEPPANLNDFFTAVAVAAANPGSEIRVRLLLPSRVSVVASRNTIEVRGAPVPRSAIDLLDSLGLLESCSTYRVVLKLEVNSVALRGGYIYTIIVSSTNKRITIKPASSKKI